MPVKTVGGIDLSAHSSSMAKSWHSRVMESGHGIKKQADTGMPWCFMMKAEVNVESK